MFLTERFRQLQVPAGGAVKQHVLVGQVGINMGKMGQVCLLGIIEILQKCSCSRQPHGKIADSQPHKGIHLKMPLQNPPAAVVVKKMRLQGVDRHMVSAPQLFHIITADQKCFVADNLRRLVFHQLVIQLF